MGNMKNLYETINKVQAKEPIVEAVNSRKLQATQKKINALVGKALAEYAKAEDEGEDAVRKVVGDLNMRISELFDEL